MPQLLTRDDFRESVFRRDGNRCVVCGAEGQDAHHIIERRLFPDGGYYLDNGATLCGPCHLRAESTQLTCEEIRRAIGVREAVLPPHLYADQPYDKWGNPILPNGTRLIGELMHDESVQKVMAPVLSLFTDKVKYPRTYHLPWSPGATSDDRIWEPQTLAWFNSERPGVVVTEKMDGENTTMYRDYMHARSLEYASHPSRNRAKAIHAALAHEIPQGWRVCAENVYAEHSIHYTNLDSYLLVFGIWDEYNICLPWEATKEWAALLLLPTVREIYRGPWDEALIRNLTVDNEKQEGYVVRPTNGFHYRDFRKMVGKYVRPNHVQTHGGWMRRELVPNELRK